MIAYYIVHSDKWIYVISQLRCFCKELYIWYKYFYHGYLSLYSAYYTVKKQWIMFSSPKKGVYCKVLETEEVFRSKAWHPGCYRWMPMFRGARTVRLRVYELIKDVSVDMDKKSTLIGIEEMLLPNATETRNSEFGNQTSGSAICHSLTRSPLNTFLALRFTKTYKKRKVLSRHQ